MIVAIVALCIIAAWAIGYVTGHMMANHEHQQREIDAVMWRERQRQKGTL